MSPPVPTYTYAPPPGQILATCFARSTMECVVRSILKTRSRHPSWVATPGGGRGGPVPAGPRLLVLPQSSRRGTAAPDSHPSSKRWATTVSVIFWLVQGRTISAKGGRAGIELGIWDMGMVSFFNIGMQTHICSPNGGQMERDIRAIPPQANHRGQHICTPPPPSHSRRDHVSGPGGPHV